MTLSALARDTARIGVLLAREMNTGVEITDAPELNPLPKTAVPPLTTIDVIYNGLPETAPGKNTWSVTPTKAIRVPTWTGVFWKEIQT